MFKKYTKGYLPTESTLSEDLADRPHSPFSTDIMNSFHSREPILNDEHQEPETIIASQVEIKGTITFNTLLQIDGTFEGELISSGKLIVGPTGSVKADIDLEEAFISGKVTGDITVKTRLVLRGRAEIRGDIKAPLISVDEGVSIIGQVNISSSEKMPEEELEEEF